MAWRLRLFIRGTSRCRNSLVYLRLPPTGPTATEYIEATRIFSRSRAQVVSASARNARGFDPRRDNCVLEGSCEPPQFPADTETALVRRAILVSNEGEPILSPITETVQLRQYRSIPDRHAAFEGGNDPQVAEFRLSQRALLEGRPSLRRAADDEKGFSTFNTQGFDFFFEPASPETLSLQSQGVRFGPSRVLAVCQACHQNPGVVRLPPTHECNLSRRNGSSSCFMRPQTSKKRRPFCAI